MLGEADGNQLLTQLQTAGFVELELPSGPLKLDGEDIEVRLQAREGWAAAQGSGCVVVLNTEVTPELRREGLAKDLIRGIQSQRKELDCQYTDRIQVAIETSDAELQSAIEEHRTMICGETLADELVIGTLANAQQVAIEGGELYVAKVSGK